MNVLHIFSIQESLLVFCFHVLAPAHSLDVGKFVAFVDIDDFVHPQMYEVLHALAEKYALDMAACAFDCVTERSVAFEQYDPAALVETAEIFSGEQALSSFFEYYRALLRAPVWCKLYNTQLVKKIGFAEGRIHEDEFFFHRIVGSCKGIGKTSAVLYYYFQSPGSIVRSTYNLKRFDIVYAMRDRFFYFKASGIEGQTNAWGAYYTKKTLSVWHFVRKEHPELADYYQAHCLKQLDDDRDALLSCKLSPIVRLQLQLLYHRPVLVDFLSYNLFARALGKLKRLLQKSKKR